MYTIEIHEEVKAKEDMIYLLEDIARSIRTGHTSGFNPTWNLVELELDVEEEIESRRTIEDLMDDDSDSLSNNEETH